MTMILHEPTPDEPYGNVYTWQGKSMTTDTMTDRERIANILTPYCWGASNPDDAADAVLAALDGRIVPVLPEDWWSLHLAKSDGGLMLIDRPAIPEGYVYATIYGEPEEDHDWKGTGPTIAAAVRGALEGGTA